MILGKKAGARYVWRLPKSALRKLSLCLLAIPLSSCWLGEQLYLSQFRDECKTIVRENESAFEKLSALSADLPYANVRPYGFHEDPDPDLIDLSVSFLNEREIKELYETGKRDFLFPKHTFQSTKKFIITIAFTFHYTDIIFSKLIIC